MDGTVVIVVVVGVVVVVGIFTVLEPVPVRVDPLVHVPGRGVVRAVDVEQRPDRDLALIRVLVVVVVAAVVVGVVVYWIGEAVAVAVSQRIDQKCGGALAPGRRESGSQDLARDPERRGTDDVVLVRIVRVAARRVRERSRLIALGSRSGSDQHRATAVAGTGGAVLEPRVLRPRKRAPRIARLCPAQILRCDDYRRSQRGLGERVAIFGAVERIELGLRGDPTLEAIIAAEPLTAGYIVRMRACAVADGRHHGLGRVHPVLEVGEDADFCGALGGIEIVRDQDRERRDVRGRVFLQIQHHELARVVDVGALRRRAVVRGARRALAQVEQLRSPREAAHGTGARVVGRLIGPASAGFGEGDRKRSLRDGRAVERVALHAVSGGQHHARCDEHARTPSAARRDAGVEIRGHGAVDQRLDARLERRRSLSFSAAEEPQ